MIETKVFYDDDSTEVIAKGINAAANAVKITLGAKGRVVYYNNAIQTQHGIQFFKPKPTKDGITVLRNFELTDQIENFGVELIKEASQRTADEVGDGTTATAVLVQAMVNEGLKLVKDGANPMQVKSGMESAVATIVAKLKESSIKIKDESGKLDIEKIRQIATVSANNDKIIGGLIADAYVKIGDNGLIKIEDAKGVKTEIKLTEGFEINTGYLSPYFLTNYGKGMCELKNPYILFFESEILSMHALLPLLEQVVSCGRSLLIFCEDLNGDAFATLANNVKDKVIKACAVKSPFYGERQVDAMNDMALLTGGKYISAAEGIPLESVTLAMCGQCGSIEVTKDKTTIIGSGTDKEKIAELIEQLKVKLSETTDEDEKDYIEKRISRLTESVAILYVGAVTENEATEKKDRCDDAVRAAKSAIEEGFVAGGGSFFASNIYDEVADTDFKKGVKLVFDAIKAPLTQLCVNAGIADIETILTKVSRETFGFGYNVLTEQIENLVDAGIIDPAKALRCELQNAASIAGTVLITGCVFARNIKN